MTLPMRRNTETLSYIPSIDGLRAIAVIGVILYHLHPDLLPGGFVGVDVFFVISGFLITRIILAESEAGQFSFRQFYQRRIARIFPVFFVVLLATLVTAKLIYTPDNFSAVGSMAAASSLCIANLKLLFQGHYFQIEPDSQPLMHYWSLSVEEQFYLILPLIIILAHRYRVTRRKLLTATVAVAIISFASCVLLTLSHPTFAFYLLPTRAWELLAGSLLAFSNLQGKQASSRWRNLLPWFGIVAILVSYFAIDGESNSFPGFIALLPVLGGASMIAGAQNSNSPINHLLAMPPMVFIGKISYSLYLWHWPIYSFIDYRLFAESFTHRTILKVVIVVVVSILSYFVIEKPSRKALTSPNLVKFALVGSAVLIVIFVVVGMWIRRTNYVEPYYSSIVSGGIVVNPHRGDPTIVLMGDSFGSMYGRSFVALAKENGYRANLINQGGNLPLPGSDYYEKSLTSIAKIKPKVTILAASWYTHGLIEKESILKSAIRDILQHSEYIVLIEAAPVLPKSALRGRIRENGLSPAFEGTQIREARLRSNDLVAQNASERVRIIQIDHIFLNGDGTIKYIDGDGRQLFNDPIHLSGYGADLVMAEVSDLLTKLLRAE
jgi:peptidoglycan/LPS O-acetylase OafA/YrhL